MLRFLPGILLIQLMACGITYAVLQDGAHSQLITVLLAIGFASAIFAAFWFAAIARLKNRELLDQIERKHARERESILVKAEREKVRVKTDSFKEMEKMTRRTTAQANFKVGAVFAAAAAAGAFMLFTQFVTIGTLVLSSAVSGLGGYVLCLRQQRNSNLMLGKGNGNGRHKNPRITATKEPKLIEGNTIQEES